MTLGKKPADQTSDHSDADAVDEVDIDLEADADDDGDDDEDDSDDDDADGDDVGSIVEKAVNKALAAQQLAFQSEMDRRINSALGGQRRTKTTAPAAKADKETESDVRGARLAFREYLPGEMKFLSTEERKMATEYGMNLIKVAAAAGFDDEDSAGKNAAEETAKFFKASRQFYSARTKKALERQGALKDQKGGQSGGGLTGTTDIANSNTAAAERRARLFGQQVTK